MPATLNDTPGGSRVHIGVFGKTNSGKSAFINAFAGQQISIVADVAGTTTDPVYKSMEIHPLGPCVLIDTAGFDDESELGASRVEKTRVAAEKAEIAVILFAGDDASENKENRDSGQRGGCAARDEDANDQNNASGSIVQNHAMDMDKIADGTKMDRDRHCAGAQYDSGNSDVKCDAAGVGQGGFSDSVPQAQFDIREELEWFQGFREHHTPVLCVVSKSDTRPDAESDALLAQIKAETGEDALLVSASTGAGMERVKEELARKLPEDYGDRQITGELVGDGDLVLLVMPQDIQAPKGRLILPQVQTLRELLDKKCLVMSVTTDKLIPALSALSAPPKLIITDSQVFGYVYEHKPAGSMLTSFSVLFAAYKGDLPYYIEGAKKIDALGPDSKVLIAECCTHAPLAEDIGREKIPGMLRKRFGDTLSVNVVSGTDFPQDLSGYDLIIQCGACMFNRKYVLSRIDRARNQGVPMTNYGVTIAHLTGILDKISMT